MEGSGRGRGGPRSRGGGDGRGGGRGRSQYYRGGGGDGGGRGVQHHQGGGGQQQQSYRQSTGGGYGGYGGSGPSGDYSPDPYQTSTQPYTQQSPGGGGRVGGGRGRGYGGGGGRGSSSSSHQQARHLGRGNQSGPESGGVSSVPAGEISVGGSGHLTGGGEGSSARSSCGSWGQAPDKTRVSPQPAAPDSVMSEIPASSQLAAPSNLGTIGKILPLKRPDVGGRNSSRFCRVFVNHYHVKFNPETVIMHYDVDIKREGSSKRKVTKADLSMIRDKLLSDNAWLRMFLTAYDGEKNIFSAEPLPTGNFVVEISEGEDTATRSFVLAIKLVNELKVCKLEEYLSGNLQLTPRDILQGMDLVMKENPSRRLVSVGRSFYPYECFRNDDLGYGIAAYRGFQPSLKPTSQGLALCLDYSVLAFRKREPVIDFLGEHIRGFNLANFRSFRRDVEYALIDLKVIVTHRRTKQKYKIAGLTADSARNLSFTIEDSEGEAPARVINLLDYFREKYGKEVTHKDIPCLNLGKNSRKNYVPMEFCVLAPGQRLPKEQIDSDRNMSAILKRLSLVHPNDRKNIIDSMVRSEDGPRGGGIAQQFGMEIDTNMTAVKGHIIGPPELKLGGRENRIRVDPNKCHWNLVGKSLVEGKSVGRWAVIDFSQSDNRMRLDPNRFIPALVQRCHKLGLRMEEPLFYERSRMQVLSDIDHLRELLEWANKEGIGRGGGRLQILLCVMSRRDPGYKNLKWISETQIGIVTQCCLSPEANKVRDQTLANIALKINAKLGGSNVELINRLPRFEKDSHVMFVGADVNHPAPQNTMSPSIAAVVATMNWPAANRYAARVCPQTHRKEKIVSFGNMCADLIDAHAKANNGVKPTKIVVFRDGVSEGQFDMVLNEELVDLKRAIETKSYRPTITLIIARKRHQTRLFPQTSRDGCETGNVHPGTVVDTVIVHPFEFDFYLCSHYGSLGTSKPTHYHVLWDEHGFTSDQLQQLIYNLCFTFARCTKAVSLVPPVYYADLVAYRGRLYQEALMDGQLESGSHPPTTSTGVSVVAEGFYRLHGSLEDAMFFV